MEAGEVNNIWQLVAFLGAIFIPLFFKYIFVDKPKNKKNKDEKKELQNEIESLKDNQQDEKISKIEKTLEWIVERMKSKDDQEKLYTTIKRNIDNIISIKKLCNSEIKHLIFNSQVAFKSLIIEVMNLNFDISMDDLYTNSIHLLKNAKQKVNRKKLNIKDPDIFLEELEDFVIKPNLEKLILNFQSLKELDNGVRRKRFAEISEIFIYQIVSKTIDRYSNYAKKEIT